MANLEALRHHSQSAQVTNWMKDTRAKLPRVIGDRSIYPKTAPEEDSGQMQ
jgi:beta-ureidopropionase